MSALAQFPITQRWPARHPDRIQLYTLGTPNGRKVSVALEELGLAYEAHKVSFETNDQFTAEFLSLNPNNKIPAILDPNGPEGTPLTLFESGAILIYLAEKTGKLLPETANARYECLQWLMWQMGGLGPMFGQLGHFHKYAADKVSDPYPRDRYLGETKRLLGVLERRLEGRAHIMGEDYTIADIAIFPWVQTLRESYGAGEITGLDALPNVNRWLNACLARPASVRGMAQPG
ncbi:glutathione S-transferase N-terminal domain-containing protein [Stappia taiwanensis]|uniref:Glutathione S-transferase N-terminal domain-containing protein n=1 Tax=Stappia taiwanensis TaxID=992267 RepID=A0A838XN31_9HYPH|nr:glutathione binding-like protein [Stappia taiwanensis]MBA4610178.1 glutathione S-transferase N-terminal domain-containing protein [Stappia taiwanensis]GGE77459.1 glutathione S-transferase [Stappia taiwanensis]